MTLSPPDPPRAIGSPRARTPHSPQLRTAAPTPHAVRERVARWGTTGRPPAGMIDAMTKHLIRELCPRARGRHNRAPVRTEDRKWAFLSERTDFQEVAA